MPDPVTHYVLGCQVLAQLPEEIRAGLELPVFQRGLQGPDPWATIGFYGGKTRKLAFRSREMHKSKTGAFLTALAKQTKREPAMFSVLAGAICHYCLDRTTHPYILSKAGTEQSDPRLGGHVRLERAIDSYYIRNAFGKTPWHFSIPRQVMACKRYPESLRSGLNRAYREVYGWRSAFDLVNRSLRDECRFYGLMQDPLGLVHMLLRLASGGKTNYSLYSFYRREITEQDYLNLSHSPWAHPYDPQILSTESFLDLFDRAKQEAAEMIRAAWQWCFGASECRIEEIFGNSNYSTGFDCEDPRNLKEPTCQPLVYSGKYWN